MENIMDARGVFSDLKDYLENCMPITIKSLECTILPDEDERQLKYSEIGTCTIVDNNRLGEKVEAVVVKTDLFCENKYITGNDQVYILELKLLKGTEHEDFTIEQVTNNAFVIIALINKMCSCQRKSERVNVMMFSDLVTSLNLQDPDNDIYFDYDYISFDNRSYKIEAKEKNKQLEATIEYRMVGGNHALIETISIMKGNKYDLQRS